MGCGECTGYWECGEGELCGGPAGGAWTVTGNMKLKIPGDNRRLVVHVKARSEKKDGEHIPLVRLWVTGVKEPDGSVLAVVPEKLDGDGDVTSAMDFYATLLEMSGKVPWKRLNAALRAVDDEVSQQG